MKTREEVEKLKRDWHRDPCWDIETEEGFEEYKDELLEYRKKCEKEWEYSRQMRHDQLKSIFCPMSFSGETFEHCLVEKCAWWNATMDRCGIVVPSDIQARDLANSER